MRVLPQAKDIESAVLGALMMDNACLREVINQLPHENVFYDSIYREIYRNVLSMYDGGLQIDTLTLATYLNDKSSRKENWFAILAEVSMGVVSTAHVNQHIKILIEKYLGREMIKICGETIESAYEGADVFDLYHRIIRDFNQSFDVKNSSVWVSSRQAANMFLEKRQQTIDQKGQVGISTTISKIDSANTGFLPGQLVVVAARPSVGKSAYAGGLVVNTARQGKGVGVICLEMTIEEQFSREISYDTEIDNKRVEKDESITSVVVAACEGLAKLPIYFLNKINVTSREITSASEYLKNKHDIQLLVIDYLQLIKSTKGQNREQAVANISRDLKTMAMALKIPVVALSQLNRESENRSDMKPRMSDIRESGAIEQDADIIMLLHRDYRVGKLTDENGESTERQADFLIPKWRNGEPVDVKIGFNPTTMKFFDPSAPLFPNPNAGISNRTFDPNPF